VGDDDGHREMALRRNGQIRSDSASVTRARGSRPPAIGAPASTGHRGLRPRRISDSGPVYADPAHRHDEAERHDHSEVRERNPGEDVHVREQVHDPDDEAADGQQDMAGDNGDGQPRRGRRLEVRVVFDQPDREQEEPAQGRYYPGAESQICHKPPPSPQGNLNAFLRYLSSYTQNGRNKFI
jgi:hypothetical protein